MARVLTVAAALLALALAGCGSDEERTVTETQTATVTQPAATTAAPAVRLESFRSPTGNIGCQMSDSTVRCDVAQRDWAPPPKPAGCDLDWGQGISLDAQGTAAFVCAGDTARDPDAPVLGYGQDSEIGGLRCASRQDGVTCRNSAGRGFFLARDRYRIF